MKEYEMGLELVYEHNLTPREAQILLLLIKEPHTRAELVEITGLKKNNLFSFLKSLSNKGLIHTQELRKDGHYVYELCVSTKN